MHASPSPDSKKPSPRQLDRAVEILTKALMDPGSDCDENVTGLGKDDSAGHVNVYLEQGDADVISAMREKAKRLSGVSVNVEIQGEVSLESERI